MSINVQRNYSYCMRRFFFFLYKTFFKVKISTCFLVFDRNHMKVRSTKIYNKKKLFGLDEKLLIFIVISKKVHEHNFSYTN